KAFTLRRLPHGKCLIDRGYDLSDRQFVETLATTVEPALAAFQLARQARQRILHEPYIAPLLNRAGRLPWRFEAAPGPRAPQPRACGAVKREGRRTGRRGQVCNRGIGSDIDARTTDQRREFRPGELAVEPHHARIAPHRVEVVTIGCRTGGGHGTAAL